MGRKEQLKAFYDSYVVSPYLERLIADMDWIRTRGQSGASTPSMIIMGDSGTGKSALLTHYVNQHLSNGSQRVLLTRVRPTLVETLQWMNNKLGGGRNSRAKASDYGLTDVVIRKLKQSSIELIVVDECQELIQNRRQKERQDVNDRLKFISEESNIPIIWVGLPCAEHLLADSQWESRAKIVHQLHYFKLSDKTGRERFIDILERITATLPVPPVEPLSDPNFGFPLFAASRGEMRSIKELIGAALMEAMDERHDSISLEHFAKAWNRFNREVKVNNPFELPLDELLVSEIETDTRFELNAEMDALVQQDRVFSTAIPLGLLLSKT